MVQISEQRKESMLRNQKQVLEDVEKALSLLNTPIVTPAETARKLKSGDTVGTLLDFTIAAMHHLHNGKAASDQGVVILSDEYFEPFVMKYLDAISKVKSPYAVLNMGLAYFMHLNPDKLAQASIMLAKDIARNDEEVDEKGLVMLRAKTLAGVDTLRDAIMETVIDSMAKYIKSTVESKHLSKWSKEVDSLLLLVVDEEMREKLDFVVSKTEKGGVAMFKKAYDHHVKQESPADVLFSTVIGYSKSPAGQDLDVTLAAQMCTRLSECILFANAGLIPGKDAIKKCYTILDEILLEGIESEA